MLPKGTTETTSLLTSSSLDCTENSTTSEPTEDNGSSDVLIEPEIETGTVEDIFSWSKLWKYTGPGFLMSIAYLDPGNLEADLQIGAVAGYSLLWILLYAHIAGLLIQCLAARIGVVSGQHLAQLIRCHYPRYISIILWLVTEIAIIGSDIQEIVGTAIALRIILRIPLWLGTMLTALDTFAFMLLQNYGMRKLEAFFMALIATMAICFWVEMFLSGVDVKEIAMGILIPSVPQRAIIQVVAMVGAVIMPHNLYLHSALVMTRKTEPSSVSKLKEANFYFAIESGIALLASYLINMAIVVVFAQVFYSPNEKKPLPGLYDAGNVLSNTLGYASKYLWAFGLLAAGQSSTMAGTLAGQYVIEGFFGKVLTKQWYRNAITRAIALVPSMLVAVYAVDNFDTMGELLNVLQSLCLPTAIIPLLKLTSSKTVMGVDFQVHSSMRIITWILAMIIIGINLFLLVLYLEEIHNIFLGYIFGGIYFTFVGYLSLLSIDNASKDLEFCDQAND